MMEYLRNWLSATNTAAQLGAIPVSEEATCDKIGEDTREDRRVCFGYVAKQGRRANMEDFTFAKFKRCSNGEQFGFFGVFDGHGGPGAADYVRSHLFVKLENDPKFPYDMPAALSNAFRQTDNDYLNTAGVCDDGCTGVVAVVKDREAWIAHVGDSRAVLISSRGDGTWRVGGVLAVSRAFGDRPLKRYVIAMPDVRCLRVDRTENTIILASDGLWDVIDNQDAGTLVYKSKGSPARKIAEDLVSEAWKRGSADNISCIVIQFKPE